MLSRQQPHNRKAQFHFGVVQKIRKLTDGRMPSVFITADDACSLILLTSAKINLHYMIFVVVFLCDVFRARINSLDNC